jgi:hypothetical protein
MIVVAKFDVKHKKGTDGFTENMEFPKMPDEQDVLSKANTVASRCYDGPYSIDIVSVEPMGGEPKTEVISPKKKKVKKVVAKKPSVPAVQMSSVDTLIQLAVEKGTGVEQLEKLMAMKYDHEAREAKKLFHEKFSEMQSKLPVIKKTKQVGNAYSYAPLEAIVEQIKPFLHEFGFSYRWTEGLTESQGIKRVTCHLTGHGHEETAHCDLPIMSASKMTNSIQQSGSSSTYGKRYSLCGLLGIMVDDDDDGQTFRSQPQNQPKSSQNGAKTPSREDYIKKIQSMYDQLNEPTESQAMWMSTIDEQQLPALQQVYGVLKKAISEQK